MLFRSRLLVSANTYLEYLVCDNNSLTSLDVSSNTALIYLSCYKNSLANLDVHLNTALTDFDCNSNSLTSLNVKNGHNSFFTSFDATINPSLTCIQVDDAAWSTDNWLNKDDAASYSTDCPLIIYVDASKADDTGDGQTWATAKKSLQTALGLAVSGDQIWVKAGTYKPGTSRDNSFGLKSDVSVYGGFAGTEISVSERSIAANETILSGEIGAATNTDNCYIVVLSKSISNALLDGFTIKGGYMNGPAPAGQWQKDGGGIHHNFSQVTYNNLKIIQNYAEWNGSGVFVTGSGLATFYNCVIADNTGNTGAGSFSVFLGYSTLNNCTFTNNSPNQITVDAGGYSNSFNNCIIWGGTNNINHY